MSAFLDHFSIRDLEAFSGVKAHTIRIWEKRYGLLNPTRSDTNIRSYSADELRTILNVAYLNRHGHKISHISALSPHQRSTLIEQLAASSEDAGETLNAMKMAMLSLDEIWFRGLSEKYEAQHGLIGLLERAYVPLLEHVGLLWQTGAIYSAQEHFLSHLVRQRIITATAQLPQPGRGTEQFVLFLPEHEIHELGLLYLNYRLRAAGKHTIYLGESVPTGDLSMVAELVSGPLCFVAVVTSFPNHAEVPRYLSVLRARLGRKDIRFLLTGAQLKGEIIPPPPTGVSLYPSVQELFRSIV